MNSNTWSIIKKCYIPYDIWINEPGDNDSWSKILLKLVLKKYNDDLKDWNVNRINQVEKAYGKVLRGIQYRR